MPWDIGEGGQYMAQWAPTALHLAQAHALATGQGVRVAVLDTGVDARHPALAGRLLPGHDFVDDDADPSEVAGPSWGHGTHVAGLIALVAPDARILPLRMLDSAGAGNAWVLGEAILHALDPDGDPSTDDGAHIINPGLGSLARAQIMASIAHLASCAAAVDDDPVAERSDPGYSDDARRCVNGNPGALSVAAAGNDGSGNVKAYPAAEGANGLLSVGASKADKRLAAFSNFGSWVPLAAPGEGITSSIPGGAWATWNDTSMAAPLAAAVAALVRSQDLKLTPKDVAERLRRTASVLCGTGLRQVDAYAAVARIEPKSGSCP